MLATVSGLRDTGIPTSGGRPPCLPPPALEGLMSNITYLFTDSHGSNDITFAEVANKTLDVNFTLHSESLSMLRNSTDINAPVWSSQEEFVHDTEGMSLPGLKGLDYFYDCRAGKIGWRWTASLAVYNLNAPEGSSQLEFGKYPVSSLMELELGSDKKIKTAYTEFNTAAWYRDIGKDCQ